MLEIIAGHTVYWTKKGHIESQGTIEKMRQLQKAHRNILDMEPGFLSTQ